MNWYQALFHFKGRLNRQGFWLGISIDVILLFSLALLFPMQQWFHQSYFTIFPLLGLIIVGWIFIAVAVKRLHDRGRSAGAVCMAFLPILCYFAAPQDNSFMAWALGRFMPLFITTLLVLDWGIFKGNPHANKYGEYGQSIQFKE